jgi:co-chaperonin GroES (HSP10)
MTCKKCGREKSKKTLADRGKFVIPFSCKACGSIKISYRPVRDVVFLFQYPAPEKTKGGIILVDDGTKYVGYGADNCYKDTMRPPLAVVLAYGPGYFDSKKHAFMETKGLSVGDDVHVSKVPWKYDLINDQGEKHKVLACGIKDIYAFEV